jgi:divalent metal cation (Fe/Co/Zn/Cd) transporter
MITQLRGDDLGSTGSPLMRRALWLVIITMLYSFLEAVVGFWAGTRAGSVALVGFSLDSVIEIAAAAIVAHRLYIQLRSGKSPHTERIETNARRFVAVTFFALGAYILWQSASALISSTGPEKSTLGIILALTSVTIMPVIASAKLRLARKLGSRALEAEAKETLACAYLSLTLLVGLVCTALFSWWWADAVAALAMIPWLIREGVEGLEGEEHNGDAGTKGEDAQDQPVDC